MKKQTGLGSNPLFNLDKSTLSVVLEKELKSENSSSLGLREIQIESISPNPFQPRQYFSDDAMDQLIESIIQHGIMQPIVVRPMQDKYQLVVGERRWRAAQKAQLSTIPSLIRILDDKTIACLALVENLQRIDLSVMEQSRALDRMRKNFELEQSELAHITNFSRSHITNLLRLLNLNSQVQFLLDKQKLNMGHARALLSLSSCLQLKVAEKVIKLNLSVRQTEVLVRKLQNPKSVTLKKNHDCDIKILEKKLSDKFGSTARIQSNHKGRGKIYIEFSSLDSLDAILEKIGI